MTPIICKKCLLVPYFYRNKRFLMVKNTVFGDNMRIPFILPLTLWRTP